MTLKDLNDEMSHLHDMIKFKHNIELPIERKIAAKHEEISKQYVGKMDKVCCDSPKREYVGKIVHFHRPLLTGDSARMVIQTSEEGNLVVRLCDATEILE